MAGTTTYYGISYPTNTDYVKDGASAMQTIADGFDSAVAIPTYNNQTGTTYTFVLADAGKTVTSNNASAVTFTIPPQASVAWANNTTLTVRNLGAGVVTIAGGAGVTVTNTAQTVAQYGSVRIIRTASNAWTVVPASGGTSGLTLISSTTIGTGVSSVTVSNAFNSTYDNYKIVITGGVASATTALTMQLGTTNTGYYYTFSYQPYGSNAITSVGRSNFASVIVGLCSINSLDSSFELRAPNLAKITSYNFNSSYTITNGEYWQGGGFVNNSTQYTAFTIAPESGTLTGGTIRVYGYQNS